MNCIEFEKALERAIETREPLTETGLSHSIGCPTCRAAWEISQQLDQAIDAWRRAVSPSQMVESILAELSLPGWQDDPEEIREISRPVDLADIGINAADDLATVRPLSTVAQTQPARRPPVVSQVLAVGSIAACLLIAAISFMLYSGDLADQSMKLVGVPKPRPGDDEPASDISQVFTLTEFLAGLQSEYREIASETTSAASEVVNTIPQRVAASVIPDEKAEADLLPSSSDVKRVWQPIGRRLETAMSFLWESVPSEVPSG